jgi:hypothetical protein
MRYRNEMAWIKSDGQNRTCRIDRVGFCGIATSTHLSEVELDGVEYDYVIQVPNGNLEELKKDALFVFDHVIQQMTPPEDISEFPEGVTEYTVDERKEDAAPIRLIAKSSGALTTPLRPFVFTART